MEEQLYRVALSIVSSPAGNGIMEVCRECTASDVWMKISSQKHLRTQDFIAKKYSSDPLEAAASIVESCKIKKIGISTIWDDFYPRMLMEIARPPVVLYFRGMLPYSANIAIVGSRNSERRSEYTSRRLARELSISGYNIVSGMAVGIDREAHLGAIEGSGSTTGVLANGIDIIYPSLNRDLYRTIESSDTACLVSEYPPGIVAGAWTFVRRNRIISGLCSGVVIVKAGEKSGALITARYAMEQNRDLFVCTGHPFDSSYEGCHALARSGAIPVFATSDIMAVVPSGEKLIQTAKPLPVKKAVIHDTINNLLSLEEKKVLEIVRGGETDVDSLVRKSSLQISMVNEALMSLELAGLLLRDGNNISLI